MTTHTAPTITKRIGQYDRATKDFPAYVVFEDGHEEYIGSSPTQHDASLLASDYIIQFYNDSHTPEAAASLIHQELAEEGRHAELARGMGAVWVEGPCWEETGAPDQETLREWAIANEAPDECTACDGSGCPWCDPELAAEATPPFRIGEAVALVEPSCPTCAGDTPCVDCSPASLTTALFIDGEDDVRTHASIAERGYYLRCNKRARIVEKPAPLLPCGDPPTHCTECGDALFLDTAATRCSCGTSAMWDIAPGVLAAVDRARERVLDEAVARMASRPTLQTECSLCYSLQECIDDGETYICADCRPGDQRQAQNKNPALTVNELAAELSGLRTAHRKALAAERYKEANDLMERAACMAEVYVTSLDEPVLVGA